MDEKAPHVDLKTSKSDGDLLAKFIASHITMKSQYLVIDVSGMTAWKGSGEITLTSLKTALNGWILGSLKSLVVVYLLF